MRNKIYLTRKKQKQKFVHFAVLKVGPNEATPIMCGCLTAVNIFDAALLLKQHTRFQSQK